MKVKRLMLMAPTHLEHIGHTTGLADYGGARDQAPKDVTIWHDHETGCFHVHHRTKGYAGSIPPGNVAMVQYVDPPKVDGGGGRKR